MNVAELQGVSLRFGEKRVLDHVTLGVQPQERLVIIGQSGAGKTTILRLVLGILAPTAGAVFFSAAGYSAADTAGVATNPPPHRDGLPGRCADQLP